MQKIYSHIAAFGQFMYSAGYDGTFVSNYGFPSKLNENLVQHALQCLQEKKPLDQITLSTYTHWNDRDKPQIRCTFQLEYAEQHGFQMKKMTIEKDDLTGTYRKKDLTIKSLNDVPEKDELLPLMNRKRHRVRL